MADLSTSPTDPRPYVAGPMHPNPAIPLDRRYWCALGLIAALIVFHQVLLQPALLQLTSDAPVINVAGRQRMLSQKLAKAALAWEATEDEAGQQSRRNELQAVMQEWSRAHRGLQSGDAELHLPGINSPQIEAAFADLEPHYTAIIGAVEDLLSVDEDDAPEKSPTRAAAVQRILTHEVEFLERMHAIVGLYEIQARLHVTQLQRMGLVVMAAILGTLLVVQFLVVRPAVQWVGREFQHSEAQYQQLVESMSDGLVVHDPQERVQFANQRFCTMVGYSLAELRGAPASLFVADGSRRRYDDFRRQPEMHSEPVEITLRHREGSVIEAIASSQPLWDAEHNPQGFVLVIADVTARRQAEQRNRELAEQLAHADRLKSMGELAAGLAHEINQPLGAIANYAEGCLATLAAEDGQNSTLQEPLQRILRAAIRGGEIIRRARSFSQLRPHEVALTQVNDLVVDVEQLCATEARRRSIDVRVELDPALPTVRVDAIQIQQVLANLIQNAFAALDSTPEYRRRLVLQTRTLADGDIEFTVSDNGCGIAADQLEKVFEPFFTTRKEGTGMGLAIVRGIIEAHGGTVTAATNSDGGTIFRCFLPLEIPALNEQSPRERVARVTESLIHTS